MTKWERIKWLGANIMAIWAGFIACKYMDKPGALYWALQFFWIGAGWFFVADAIRENARDNARIRALEKRVDDLERAELKAREFYP